MEDEQLATLLSGRHGLGAIGERCAGLEYRVLTPYQWVHWGGGHVSPFRVVNQLCMVINCIANYMQSFSVLCDVK